MQRRLGGRLGTAVLVLAGIIAVGPVSADPIPGEVLIYSNFGPGGSFDTTMGWTIGHFPGTGSQVVGQSFTTTSSLQFADAQLAMSGAVGTSAAVYLESDNGGQPGTILDTLVEQNPIGMTPGIVTFNCRLCVTLSAGTQYWIVAAEGNGNTIWIWNNISDNSGLAVNHAGSATGPWMVSMEINSPGQKSRIPEIGLQGIESA
jgi:hypothetical protein